MEKMKNVPEIRFEGFSEDWNKISFEDITTGIGDGIHGTPTYVSNSNIYFINGNNLKSGKINIDKETNQVSQDQLTNGDKSLNKNTILISINGTIGNVAFYNCENVMLGKSVAYLNLDGVNKDYVFTLLQSPHLQNYFVDNLTGSTIKNLGLKTIRETEIFLPEAEEQKAIGTFFQNLDNSIKNHNTQLKKLTNLKKAMLIKMFPQDDASIPEIRFKGFDGEWEEKQLNDLADIVRGASPRPIKDPKWFDKSSEIGWLRISDVTSQDGKIKYLSQRISEAGQEKTRVLKTQHLLLSIAASVGKPVLNYVKTGVHDGFLIFLDPKFELNFMFQWLKMFEPKWQIYGQPGSQVNLNSDIVKNHKVFIPCESEQKQIGDFFDNTDRQIENHKEQLKKLNQIKKACLSKLFVSQD